MQTLSVKVTVATPGTPVQVKSTSTPACRVLVTPLSGNTGNTYFGMASLNKSTLANVAKVFLPAPSTGIQDVFDTNSQEDDPIDLSAFWVDADVATHGLLVTYFVR